MRLRLLGIGLFVLAAGCGPGSSEPLPEGDLAISVAAGMASEPVEFGAPFRL